MALQALTIEEINRLRINSFNPYSGTLGAGFTFVRSAIDDDVTLNTYTVNQQDVINEIVLQQIKDDSGPIDEVIMFTLNRNVPELINYDFDRTFQTTGQMYSKNNGSFPNDLALNSGQGVLLNSASFQTITIPVNETIGTRAYYSDGTLIITDDFGAVTDYDIPQDVVTKDHYLFTRNLTVTEKTKLQNDPNGFYNDVIDGTITGCVLNMPLSEGDMYAYDYANYSEDSNDLTPTAIDANWTDNLDGTYTSNGSGGFIRFINKGVIGYTIQSIEVITNNQVGILTNLYDGIGQRRIDSLNNGDIDSYIENCEVDDLFIYSASGNIATIRPLFSKPLTGIYEKIAFSQSQVDLASNLPYGLSLANYRVDSLYRILEPSPFFEASAFYDNYGDMQYFLDSSKSFTVRAIIDISDVQGTSGDFRFSGGQYNGRDMIFGLSNTGLLQAQIGLIQKIDSVLSGVVFINLKYDHTTDMCSIKFNDGAETTGIAGYTGVSTTPLAIGCMLDVLGGRRFCDYPIRLTNLDESYSTDQEDTDAFTEAQNSGLLTPLGALALANGNIVLDVDDNYIIPTEG